MKFCKKKKMQNRGKAVTESESPSSCYKVTCNFNHWVRMGESIFLLSCFIQTITQMINSAKIEPPKLIASPILNIL